MHWPDTWCICHLSHEFFIQKTVPRNRKSKKLNFWALKIISFCNFGVHKLEDSLNIHQSKFLSKCRFLDCLLVMSLSWNFKSWTELSRAELGHLNFRAETKLTLCTSISSKFLPHVKNYIENFPILYFYYD